MSRTKLLLHLVQDIRSVAESLEEIASAIADDDASPNQTTSPEPTPAATAAPVTTPASAAKASEPPLDLVALRSYVASKAPTKEQKLQVKAILNKRGYAKITELPEAEYASFKEEVDALV